MTVKNTSKARQGGLLFSYYLVLSFWAAQTLGMSMLSRNVGGQTKKTVVVAANFISWAVGNAIGSSAPGNLFCQQLLTQRRTASLPHLGRASVSDRIFHPHGLLRSSSLGSCLPEILVEISEREERQVTSGARSCWHIGSC